MKKLGMMIMVLLFTGMGMVNAQQTQTTVRPGQQYFEKNVLPVMKKEQAKLVEALTKNEKQELVQIKEELKAFRAQGQQMRGSMKGNFNQQAMDSRKLAFDAIKVKADKLVAAHPKAAAAYEAAIQTAKGQWVKGMQALRNNKMGSRGGKQHMQANNLGQYSFLNRISDPAFGLLMDTDNFQMKGMMMGRQQPKGMNRQGMGKSGMRGHKYMRGQQGMQGQRDMRGQGMRGQQAMHGQRMTNRCSGMQAGMKAMRNPEVRAKIEAYAKVNIFPVISKERTAFDSKLSNKEKKQIAKARKQVETRRAMMQKRIQDPNFVPGQGMDDSTRMAQRLEMQKTMLPVREIALKHYTEIQSIITQIKGQSEQWRSDIRGLVNPMNQGRRHMQKKMANKKGNHQNGALRFLLYDPANPQMPFMK